MKKDTKSSYSVLSNIGFMVKTAWGTYKQVLVLCVLYGLFDLMVNVVQLFVAPTVLRQVHSGVTAAQLIQTILMFAGLLFLANAGKSYTDDNSLYGRIAVRSVLIRRMENHFATTSYPNTQDPHYLALTERVIHTVNSNRAATGMDLTGWSGTYYLSRCFSQIAGHPADHQSFNQRCSIPCLPENEPVGT